MEHIGTYNCSITYSKTYEGACQNVIGTCWSVIESLCPVFSEGFPDRPIYIYICGCVSFVSQRAGIGVYTQSQGGLTDRDKASWNMIVDMSARLFRKHIPSRMRGAS